MGSSRRKPQKVGAPLRVKLLPAPKRVPEAAPEITTPAQLRAAIEKLSPSHPVTDRFSTVQWQVGPHGSPILHGISAWFDCAAHQVYENGV